MNDDIDPDADRSHGEELADLSGHRSYSTSSDDGDAPEHADGGAAKRRRLGAISFSPVLFEYVETRAVLVGDLPPRVAKEDAFRKMFRTLLDLRLYERAAQLVANDYTAVRIPPGTLVDAVCRTVTAFAVHEIPALETLVEKLMWVHEVYHQKMRISKRFLELALRLLHSSTSQARLAQHVSRCDLSFHHSLDHVGSVDYQSRHLPFLRALLVRAPGAFVTTTTSAAFKPSTDGVAIAMARTMLRFTGDRDFDRVLARDYEAPNRLIAFVAPHATIAELCFFVGRLACFRGYWIVSRSQVPDWYKFHLVAPRHFMPPAVLQRMQRWRYAQYVYPLLQAEFVDTYPLVWVLEWLFPSTDVTELQAVRIVERLRAWYRAQVAHRVPVSARAALVSERADIRLLD